MALFHEVVKSIELVRYLTVHVELEIEIDTAAVKQDGGTAASWLLPIHCAFVPLQENPCCSAEALFQPKTQVYFLDFCCCFLCVSIVFFFRLLLLRCCLSEFLFVIFPFSLFCASCCHPILVLQCLCLRLPLAMWPAHLCSRCFFLCLGPFRILS